MIEYPPLSEEWVPIELYDIHHEVIYIVHVPKRVMRCMFSMGYPSETETAQKVYEQTGVYPVKYNLENGTIGN